MNVFFEGNALANFFAEELIDECVRNISAYWFYWENFNG